MKILIPFLLLLIAGNLFGQGIPSEYNWCFGDHAGVSFTTGSPVAFNSGVDTNEGSASVSSSTGVLLLQADGNSVHRANNAVLSNGSGLQGSTIAAQSNLFVPDPGNAQRYYLFTVSNWTDSSPSLRYSLIDMTLNSGAGAVIAAQKNVLVGANTREQLTATRHSNGVDWWIVAHRFGNTEFTAYLLTATGVNTTPVVSAVGMLYAGANRFGSLKFSHGCPKKLVSVLGGGASATERVQLYDFDNTTGVVSNAVTLATSTNLVNAYSAEFSPDDSKLYVTAYDSPAIRQFNLNSSNIPGSIVLIGNNVGLGDKTWVQLGPDGKIYVSLYNTNFLGRINSPNLAGTLCDYQHTAVNLGAGECGLALPNFPNSLSAAPAINAGAPVSLCSGDTAQLQPVGNMLPGYTYSWGPATGLNDPGVYSPDVTLVNTTGVPVTQTYTLTANGGTGCVSTASVQVTVNPNPVVDAGAPLTFCNGATGQLQPQGQQPGYAYLWSPATGLSSTTAFNPTVTLQNTGSQAFTATYTLTATANGCSSSDVVAVTVTPSVAVNAGAPVTICSGASAQLQPAPLPGYTYVWSPATGLSDPGVLTPTVTLTNTTNLPVTQTYTLTATSGNCSGSSEVTVTVWPALVAVAGPDKFTCSGSPTEIGAGQLAGLTYSWSPATGLSNPALANPQVLVSHTGLTDTVITYSLTVTHAAGCQASNQVQVTVKPLPQVNAGAPITLCSGDAGQLQPQGPQPGYAYNWSPAAGLSDPSAFNPTVTLANTTNLPVTQTYSLTATNNGCSNAASVQVTVNPVATGIINGSVAICPGQSPVGYLFTGTAGATAGTWGVNGGTLTQQPGSDSVTVTWGGTNQNASVWVIPTNGFNCPGDTITLPVVIRATQQTQTPAGPASLCSNALTNHIYSITPVGASYTYQWGIQGGQIVSGGSTNQVQVNWQSPGQGQLWVLQYPLASTDTCYTTSDTLTIEILAAPNPTLSIIGNTQLCTGTNATFSLGGSGTSTYVWQAQGGQISNGQGSGTIEVIWSVPGTYSITVMETNAGGCVGPLFSLPVTVQGPVTTVLSAPDAFCTGGAEGLVYSVQGSPGSVFNWQIVGGQLSSGQGTSQVTVNWDSTATAFSLQVTETSGIGCIGAAVSFPVVFDNTKLHLMFVTVDTVNESQVLVYYQVADAQNFPQSQILVQRLQSPGTYISAGNSGVTANAFIDTGLATGQQAFYYRLQGQNLCAGELLSNEHATVWLQGQAQGNTVTLSWTPYVGWGNQQVQYQIWRKLENVPTFELLPSLTTTQTSVQADLGQDGLTQCFRIVALAADTRQSWSNSICLQFQSPLVVPNIITPNADGFNDELVINKLHLYPNSELLILNRWGKEVYRNSNYQNNWRADGLAGGLYFYQLTVPGKPLLKGWVEVMK